MTRTIAVIGLGYVGLPLALEFAKKYEVIGFDISKKRVESLSKGHDVTKEVFSRDLDNSQISFTNNLADLEEINTFIICVPTPIDPKNKPDLRPLENASRDIGGCIKKGDIVIYESTVYPGATREICIPILEDQSGLKLNQDFYVGYSPERINPGDGNHRLTDIVKITSGSNDYSRKEINDMYESIINAGTHSVSSIEVAESAKVIENIQRDINIALVNELSIIFKRLNLDTEEIINASSTKWNFTKYTPGLVGGHCIGVDPYYLIHKSKQIGHEPQIITAGRKINDDMHLVISKSLVQAMIEKKIEPQFSKLIVMGFTFKEDCPDVRNTRVYNLIKELELQKIEVSIYDPIADFEGHESCNSLNIVNEIKEDYYDAAIFAVAHQEFRSIEIAQFRKSLKNNSIIADLKYIFHRSQTDLRI